MTLDALRAAIVAWGDRTFPGSTPSSIVAHLVEEVRELTGAVDELGRLAWRCRHPSMGVWNTEDRTTCWYCEAPRPDKVAAVGEEIADCLMILFHLGHRVGVDVASALELKFTACQTRTWLPPDERGVVRHAPDDAGRG